MKNIKNQKIHKVSLAFSLVGGLVLSSLNVHLVQDGHDIGLSVWHSETIKSLHTHDKHFALRDYRAGNYIDPRHLRHIGSGTHKLNSNDLASNPWNYYLITTA